MTDRLLFKDFQRIIKSINDIIQENKMVLSKLRISITLFKLDAELKKYYSIPCEAPGFRKIVNTSNNYYTRRK